jgi:bifunctional enzyme CysN/CysC
MTAAVARSSALQPQAEPAPANDPVPKPDGPSLLRFFTCGSVDDGKSTLIGHMLYEAGAVFDDQLSALNKDSRTYGTTGGNIDYALLVDGLTAEREQGITIDVAYRYFSTPKRAFIVADTPGHEQYTRNMATGASSADLAIILIDARKGLLPQTLRHSFIVSLVGVKHVVVAVNKMDLVGYDESVFRRIEADYRKAVATLGFTSILCIPVSAVAGDNIVNLSPAMPWYKGTTLLSHLETAEVESGQASSGFVLPVQWVNRPDQNFRGFAGMVASGSIQPGEPVTVLPSRRQSRVARLVTFDGDLPRAQAGQSLTLTLADEVDISRGDVLIAGKAKDLVKASDSIKARILVTGEVVLKAGDRFMIKIGGAMAMATLAGGLQGIDITRYETAETASLPPNGIGIVTLHLDRAIPLARYSDIRDLGGLILIDRVSNQTVALGVISDLLEPGTAASSLLGKTGSADQPSVTDTILIRWLGPDWRHAIGPAVSWRLGTAALLGAGLYALTGRPGLALGVAVADLLARPVLRLVHSALWRGRGRNPRPELGVDGGGI